VYNLNSNQLRIIGKEDEMFVAYNGPDIGEANYVLMTTSSLQGPGWHFTTNTPFKGVGITVDKY
jgi:hypothetical protein